MLQSRNLGFAYGVLADRGRGGRQRPRLSGGWSRTRLASTLDLLVERHPLAIVVGSLALAAACLLYALWPVAQETGPPRTRLRYDANLLQLQAQGLTSVRLAEEILHDKGLSGMFAAITCDDLATLRRLQRDVATLPSVAASSSILDVVPARLPGPDKEYRRESQHENRQRPPRPRTSPAGVDVECLRVFHRPLATVKKDPVRRGNPATLSTYAAILW